MPVPVATYVPLPYAPTDRYVPNGRLIDLIRAQGQDAANAQLRSGEIQANMWGNLGNTIQGTTQQIIKQQQDAPRIAAEKANAEAAALRTQQLKQQQTDQSSIDAAMTTPSGPTPTGVPMPAPTRQQVLDALPGHLKGVVQKQYDDADANALKVQETKANLLKSQDAHIAAVNDHLGGLGYAIVQHNGDPFAAKIAIDEAKKTYADDPQMMSQIAQLEQQIAANPDPKALMTLGGVFASKSEKYAALMKKPEGFSLNPNETRYDGNGKLLVTAPPAPEKAPPAPQVGSLADYLTRYATEHGKSVADLTTTEINIAAQQHTNATQKTPPGPDANVISDVHEAVLAMKDGTAPPLLPGRATKEYLATMAEAHRQGFDLASANLDWTATTKHVATLNGQQQTRLNQSINALPELLDSIDALSAKWKGGQFPLLNKANLALAKGGAYGPDAASIANQLDAQIADVTADLGNVYMGGNSPTDQALGLAKKALSADWDQKVLADMTKLARQNVVIRRNSIKNTGVQGASDNNPYVPPAAIKPKSDPLGIFK